MDTADDVEASVGRVIALNRRRTRSSNELFEARLPPHVGIYFAVDTVTVASPGCPCARGERTRQYKLISQAPSNAAELALEISVQCKP